MICKLIKIKAIAGASMDFASAKSNEKFDMTVKYDINMDIISYNEDISIDMLPTDF